MWKKLLPWKYLLKQAARAHGVIDPIAFVNRLRKFAEPSEIDEPIELLRAGIIFHARGLFNTKAIQHNLDWVWPYWVERQFNPKDVSFVPRAFSFSHVNLTQRNWTAVGLPDAALYPIVDPRGLVTPLHDGWSIDLWIIGDKERQLLPSRLPEVRQRWVNKEDQTLMTACEHEGMRLVSTVTLVMDDGKPLLRITVKALSNSPGQLVVALRPYNPEGVSFIEKIGYASGFLRINDEALVTLLGEPERVCFSDYRTGDVFYQLRNKRLPSLGITCDTGMATAAALYSLAPGRVREIECDIPLTGKNKKLRSVTGGRGWPEVLREAAVLQLPDGRFREIYEAAVSTLVLLTAAEPVAGPYTYRRFWFRDACLMLHALLALGFEERTWKHIRAFPQRQKRSGYYHSQDGEWDSNGQVLWLVHRFHQCTGRELDSALWDSILCGAKWLKGKRISSSGPHRGLLPPGFSAEHLGPNDYYYWDDCWAVAGLRGAARLAARFQREGATWLQTEADDLFRVMTESIENVDPERAKGGIPASPNRRLDAGAIGSLVADYPLQLFPAHHRRIKATADFLLANCMHSGGFFQDIIHAGINAYLTLALAQTLLRHGDNRYRAVMKAIADLATSTGHWPEAIHPITGGGCMGDGQHGWAAAEWVMMVRNLFIREEEDELVIGSGIFPEWLETDAALAFGPTPTPFGRVKVEINGAKDRKTLRVDADWRRPPALRIAVPGYVSRPQKEGTHVYLLQSTGVREQEIG